MTGATWARSARIQIARAELPRLLAGCFGIYLLLGELGVIAPLFDAAHNTLETGLVAILLVFQGRTESPLGWGLLSLALALIGLLMVGHTALQLVNAGAAETGDPIKALIVASITMGANLLSWRWMRRVERRLENEHIRVLELPHLFADFIMSSVVFGAMAFISVAPLVAALFGIAVPAVVVPLVDVLATAGLAAVVLWLAVKSLREAMRKASQNKGGGASPHLG